jgi:hypothetical protein
MRNSRRQNDDSPNYSLLRGLESSLRLTFDARGADTRQNVALALAVAAGIGLRVWQYGSHVSLWLDEAALARNIIDRSPRELMAPLSYGQVAPLGFLLLQKTIVATWSSSESALRALPFLCGIGSLSLFISIARSTLAGPSVVYAVLLFCLAQPFVYFSSQVKQYSSDVAASLAAILLGIIVSTGSLSRRSVLFVIAVGLLLPWISTSGALVLAGVGLGIASIQFKEGRLAAGSVLSILILWGVSAIAAAVVSIKMVSPEAREYLDWFWRTAYAPPRPWALVDWTWNTLTNVFASFGVEAFRTNGGFGYVWPQLFAATTLLGVVQLVRTNRHLARVLFLPIALAMATSMLRLYPLSGRLLVFLVPILLFATAAGAHALTRWFWSRSKLAGAILSAIFISVPLHAAIRTRPPFDLQPLRPVLERVEQLRRPDDTIYVDYAAAQAFLYYAPRFGIAPNEYVISRCSLSDRRDYLRQVDQFRGRTRVWIIATHLSAVEQSLTVGYLEEIGYRIASVFVAPVGAPLRYAAYARLYDLSDPRRLARSSAATYQFRELPLEPEARRWGCFGPALAVE